MIRAERVLGLVPARGGSKGIPRKNLQELGGRPLIAWSIAAGKASRYIDRVVVSTEDEEIAAAALAAGAEVPFRRAPELSMDDTPGMAPVLDALDRLPGYAWLVLLQPTSPLRATVDVDACIEECLRANAPSCISVSVPAHSPYLCFSVDGRRRLAPVLGWESVNARRQDLPAVYSLNGAVYVAQTQWLLAQRSFVSPETVAHVMPAQRSLDIDTLHDLDLARMMVSNLRSPVS